MKRAHLPLAPAGAGFERLALPEQPFVPPDVAPLTLREGDLAERSVLRTSSYVIYVDLPGNPDEMLLVHGYTGAYDRVSKRVATYLRSLEARRPPKPLYGDWSPEPEIEGEVVAPSDETVAVLEQRGYLVKLTPSEEEALFVRLASRFHLAAIRNQPSYVLMPTYQCNLRCPYCFQDHMRTDPAYGHLLRTMDRPMAARILEGMRAIDHAHGIAEDAATTRYVTFFGGEPLLAQSRPIVEFFVEELLARGKTRFVAITNATELEAYEDLLGPEKIARLQITLDGPPAEHDVRRIYPDGSGSFERIAANLEMALARDVAVSIRLNIDRGNINRLPVLAEELEARGWTSNPRFSVYVAPVHAANDHVSRASTFDSWQLGRALSELEAQHPKLERIGMFDDSLEEQARSIFSGTRTAAPMFRSSFCGAHSTMYVIDAFADIYACWERTGDPKLRIGYIEESGAVMMDRFVLERWRGRNIVSNPVCRRCRYATSCGGGCAAVAEDTSGDAYTNHCDGFGKRFRASVAKAYADHLHGEDRGPSQSRLCDV